MGNILLRQKYIGNAEFRNDTLEAVYHDDGRLTPKEDGGWQHEYVLRDHLGNTRVMFADKDDNGAVDETEILQQNHYYPFGMNQEGAWGVPEHGNKYQYNGIEHNNDFGINVNMALFRTYDPALGRWWQTDPRPSDPIGLYVGMGNNPLLLSDMLGDTTRLYNKEGVLFWTINDSHENQEHFFTSTSSLWQFKKLLSLLIDNQSGRVSDDEAGSQARLISSMFIGKNTREEMKQMSISDPQGLESGFVLYAGGGSKELKVMGVRTTDRTTNGAKVPTNLELPEGNYYLGFGHTHTKQGYIAVYKTSKLTFSILDATGSVDYENFLDQGSNTARVQFIASPIGYSIYSSSETTPAYLKKSHPYPMYIPNQGHYYNYQGHLIKIVKE